MHRRYGVARLMAANDMNDDVLAFLDDDGDIPVVGGGKKRLVKGGEFVDAAAELVTPPAPKLVPSVDTSHSVSSAPSEPAKKSTVGDFDLGSQLEKDELDLKKAAERLAERGTSLGGLSVMASAIDQLVTKAIDECGVVLADDDMRKRFTAIVRTYFRDLRDALETKSKITMPIASGGMGLDDAEGGRVMGVLRGHHDAFQGSLRKEKASEKELFVAKKAERQLTAQDDREKKEQEGRDSVFANVTGQGVSTSPSGMRPSPTPVAPPRAIPIVSLDKKKELPVQPPASPPVPSAPQPTPKPPASPSSSVTVTSSPPVASPSMAEKPKESPVISSPKPVLQSKNLPTAAPTPSATVPPEKPLVPKAAPPPDLPLGEIPPTASTGTSPKPVSVGSLLVPPPQKAADGFSARQKNAEPDSSEGVPKSSVSGSSVQSPGSTEAKVVAASVALPKASSPSSPPSPRPSASSMATPPSSPRPPTPSPVSAPPQKPVAPTPPMQSTAPSEKPVMSDVTFARKLTGPVEELRSISLVDFRRLSSDPKERILKLKDKIDLLEDQSFEMKTNGIKAWQESGANKLYLEMLRRSLEGKPMAEVIAQMEAKGEDVLTKPEFDAIMELNRTLRFG